MRQWRKVPWWVFSKEHCKHTAGRWVQDKRLMSSLRGLMSSLRGLMSSLRGAWRDHSLSHFPDFYTKQALKVWRSPLHTVFYWNVKGKTRKKRKNTASFMASLGTGVQPRSTVQLFMPVSRCRKTAVLAVFSRLWGVIWRGKLFVTSNASSNKKQEFEQRKRIKLFDNFWVRAYRFDFAPEAPASSTVDVNSRFSRFQFSAFWSNGLASSVFTFASILLRFFFFIVFVYARAKIRCYRFFNFDLRKSYASSKANW